MTAQQDRDFSASVATHRVAIYRYILGIVRDSAAAADLTQDSLLRAQHRAREKLRSALARACSFTADERGVLVCDPKLPRDEE
jgi:DNA-directed RNA polymerase specialized sigma24 family protein